MQLIYKQQQYDNIHENEIDERGHRKNAGRAGVQLKSKCQGKCKQACVCV